MLSFVYGALGVIVALGLVAVGAFAGWRGHAKFTEKAKVAAESQFTEEQVKQFKADKVAFDTMLQYDAATAYGINRDIKELLKEDS